MELPEPGGSARLVIAAGQAVALLDGLLPVPPFPGARPFAPFRPAAAPRSPDQAAALELVHAMRHSRLGGTSWGERPHLPRRDLHLLRAGPGAGGGDVEADFRWQHNGVQDPWWLFDHAAEITVSGDDAAALLAAIAGIPVRIVGSTRLGVLGQSLPAPPMVDGVVAALLADLLSLVDCHDPVTGGAVSPAELVSRYSLWRELIDENRQLRAAYGFARWKRKTVAPMLWGGEGSRDLFRRATSRSLASLPPRSPVAVWKARIPAQALASIERTGLAVHEVEDGFIRSVGLGANCVPPLSIVVDPLGVHYDPARPSRLESLLAAGISDQALLGRARALRARIVASGVSKYGVGAGSLPRLGGTRQHLLVIGQVEDDRSVRYGCGAIRTNLALLEAVRREAPDAWIIYRPHPDIEAGHRPGRIAADKLAALADQVEPEAPISALIATVDQVHVMTSLAGFEALLHGKGVTTWGAPFYAGWGLTEDRDRRWSRRRGNRTLDELIAVTLLLYPRYVDPVSALPCEAETLIDRLIAGKVPATGWLVRLRTWYGGGKRIMARQGRGTG